MAVRDDNKKWQYNGLTLAAVAGSEWGGSDLGFWGGGVSGRGFVGMSQVGNCLQWQHRQGSPLTYFVNICGL